MFNRSTSHPRSRRGLAAGIALTAALGATLLVPSVAFAAPDTKGKPGKPPVIQPVPGPLMNYTVNVTKANHGQTKKVERAIEAAGGAVIESYDEIGVVIAQSSNAVFSQMLASEKAVESVGATRTAPVSETDATFGVSESLAPSDPGRLRATGAETETKDAGVEALVDVVPDPSENRQWDMAAIGADKAHEITDGSRNVLVAVIDSGIQGDHPDLVANVDVAASASCLSGVADSSYDSWQPTNSSHGTHVAGTIAAARNGIGIVGVAPNVRVSAVKVVNDDGFIYPEAAICGFMHATATGADVTNNSYYIDPWEFWCDNDADQSAVKTAVDRAVQYSQKKGVVNVAAAGNSNLDLANKTVSSSSPNDTVPVTRDISVGCADIPAELDGVVTVSSTTSTGARSSFSNYGRDVIDIAAPGSSILSTVLNSGYGTSSGTSMASPHVAGVAALLKSAHPKYSGQKLTEVLYSQATDVPCPVGVAQCTGTTADNGFFGEGLVDALKAVN
ncbi:S8 family serine peptidase [Leifsonia sp. A12D58]|uniref:S8 family serine peptidase n=1 Tax=Leifsonia sp. A12D58 TaxID=3397674 RepID=UPI0039E1C7F2